MTVMDPELRVLIVADDPLARTGLATLLANQPELDVVGQVPWASDLETVLDVYEPDALVWDLAWDPSLALESLGDLAELGPFIVALLPDETYAAAVWSAGARGLLLREVTAEHLTAALKAVAQGLSVLDPKLADAVQPSGELVPAPLAEELTPRESEVLQLLARLAYRNADLDLAQRAYADLLQAGFEAEIQDRLYAGILAWLDDDPTRAVDLLRGAFAELPP